MKRLTVISVLLLALCQWNYAQQASIKGTVIDTAEKKNLSNSVIALLRRHDSVLVQFARSDKDGSFTLKSLPAGKFFIMITHPFYADYVDEVTLAANDVKSMGNVMLTPKAALLEEVIVRQNIAIRIKGDTIEYKADSFKVSEGANVQELLRKMPGFQVDRNGAITAHGKKVEKVLVDGEEFFSDDPAVVTQNLRADAIDKVQSFDKKSDQAEFSGVDDGQRTKTVNLVLKDDKKKGYFGKLAAGGGTDKRYSGEAMLNYFKGKKKLAAYGILSNTGKIGLSWQDRDRFGGGNDFGDANVEIGAGFIMINNSGADNEFNDFGNTYYGEGVPRSMKAGAHFSNKWNRDYNHINGNYSIKTEDNDAQGSSLTKYILPDSAYYFHENHRKVSSQMQQLFTGFYDLKLDSFSSIRFRFNGMTGNTKTDLFTTSGSDNENLQRVNFNSRSNSSNTDNRAVMASVLWKQRLRKAGRTLSLGASHKYTDNTSTGFLVSLTDFYNSNGQVYDSDSIDQYKESYNRTLTTQTKLIYTEPLSRKTVLELNYSYNRVSSESDRKSFDKTSNGKYEQLNRIFSNNYGLLYDANSGGAKIQYNGKKLVANMGTNLGVSNYIQTDSAGKEVRHFRYTNLFPTARINYRFSQQRSLMINYNGTPQPPTISQIQPVFENTDPLNITIGNPAIKQAFQHNISLFFTDFKVLSGRNVWINGSYNTTHNAIVNSQVTDSIGRRTVQYVNTQGNNNYNLWASYGFKIKKPEINISLNVNGSGNRYINYINNLKNTSNNNRIGLGMDIYKYRENKYNFNVGAGFTRNFSVSSISNIKSNFWTQNHNADVNVYITKKWQVGSGIDVEIRQKVDAFDGNNNVTTWNAFITRKFFSKNNAELKFEAFDLLNQRKGYSRQFTANYVTEKTYQVLRQYFLLSFTWNFTKNAATDPK